MALDANYELVGEVIADELFGSESAGRPVYTLADPEALSRITDGAGLTGDPLTSLTGLVQATITTEDPGIAPFRWQSEAARRHRLQPLETPPALPLLLVLTLAAERMHADSKMAAHNYYSRLHALLGVSADQEHRVESDYRRHAASLWGSLNTWLEAWEGERGIPTAYAIGGHAYIGLPLSQAVVRQHDRAGLHELFVLEGLTPGLRLAPSDMGAMMEPYASRAPSPLSSNLRQLWTVPAARERIVDAACLELESWHSSDQNTGKTERSPSITRLLAFRRTFPRKSIEFNIVFPYRSETGNIARFQSALCEVSVPTTAAPGGSTRLASVQAITTESIIEDSLVGYLGVDDSRPFERRPRRVMPLRWDALQGAYIEVERISLGEDSLVLARKEARARVEGHLGAHARPGWREFNAVTGMPEGWICYEQVQVISSPAERGHLDLLPLSPRARTSLTLQGGFALPGLLRKWSSLDPPEIVALAADASIVSVRIYEGGRIASDSLLEQIDTDGELTVVSLTNLELEDGEYVIAMFVDNSNRPSATMQLRLRSAASPQFNIEEVDNRLVYSPESSGSWPLTAGPAEWLSFINGAGLTGTPIVERVEEMRGPEFRVRERKQTERPAKVRVGLPMRADSCLATGKHRFHLPTVRPGQPQTPTIEGECSTCGLVRRFAGTSWAARKRGLDPSIAKPCVRIPPIAFESGEPKLQVALDALGHVGHGNYATFQRISAQIEGSGLFADSFLRRQEVLGHIDVARDPWMQVTEWAMNSAELIPVATSRWVLIGFRSRKLLQQLGQALDGAALLSESVDAGQGLVEVAGDISDVSARVAQLTKIDVLLAKKSPALDIANALPPLSSVAAALKRISVPSHRTVERWDTATASWEIAASLRDVGAYRLRDFQTLYVIRSSADIDAGTVAIGTAQLVKHIANMWVGDPLAGHHVASGSVVTPLGADLPGIYGRALTVCSGRAPREMVQHRMVQYQSVPSDVADAVLARLIQ